MRLPEQVQWILGVLEQHGFQGYAVGGCVRDSLLGRVPNDWDVCTDALPGQVQQCFAGQRVVETGLAHGTVTLVLEHRPFEITTYRVDGAYADHRRPDQVRFVRSLPLDLARRDFTINAMACGLDGLIQDPFCGRQDLEARLVRCVGEPEQRFEEDALRILRALRFASVLEFALDPATLAAARARQQLLGAVSAERVFLELDKLLCGPGVGPVLKQCGDILAQIIPEIRPCIGFDQQNPCHDRDVWTHIVDALAAAPPDPVLRWALLLHDVAKPECFTLDENGVGHSYGHQERGEQIAHRILRRLKVPKKLEQQVCRLIGCHDAVLDPDRATAHRWLNRLGREQLPRLLQMKRCDIAAHAMVPRMQQRARELEVFAGHVQQLLDENACISLGELAVKGSDLVKLGVPAGPTVGRALDCLLAQVLMERLPNRRADLLAWVSRRPQTFKIEKSTASGPCPEADHREEV